MIRHESATARLQTATGKWLIKLNQVPGWNEWKHDVVGHTLWIDDRWPGFEKSMTDFALPAYIDREHAVVTTYYALLSTLGSLRDCEYYFRRYPFTGMPIPKYEHLRYICEMYFGRFYEFRSRLKECFKAIVAILQPSQRLNAGELIKAFDKDFDQELRERNKIHHHNRFEDIGIDNLFLTAIASTENQAGSGWRKRNDVAYRRVSKEWAARVVTRSTRIEVYLDTVAQFILENCKFLQEFLGPG